MGVHFDDLILNKIKKYLGGDILSDFSEIRMNFRNLSGVSQKFAGIFDMSDHFRNYFESKLKYIAFWPYQKSSADSDYLRPLRHDYDMVDYVTNWRDCPRCLNRIIETLIDSDQIENPVEETQFLSHQADLFFCRNHLIDLKTRNRIKIWQTITFQLHPDRHDNLVAKIQIIIQGPPSPRKWC